MKANNEKFYKAMKKFVNTEENNEYTMSDYLSEVGDMMNDYNLSTEDLQEIVDTYDS